MTSRSAYVRATRAALALLMANGQVSAQAADGGGSVEATMDGGLSAPAVPPALVKRKWKVEPVRHCPSTFDGGSGICFPKEEAGEVEIILKDYHYTKTEAQACDRALGACKRADAAQQRATEAEQRVSAALERVDVANQKALAAADARAEHLAKAAAGRPAWLDVLIVFGSFVLGGLTTVGIQRLVGR